MRGSARDRHELTYLIFSVVRLFSHFLGGGRINLAEKVELRQCDLFCHQIPPLVRECYQDAR